MYVLVIISRSRSAQPLQSPGVLDGASRPRYARRACSTKTSENASARQVSKELASELFLENVSYRSQKRSEFRPKIQPPKRLTQWCLTI